MREQTTYNKVVNIAEDGEITVLGYVFEHDNNFRGATGNKFYPVSKSDYEYRTALKYIIQYLAECCPVEDIPWEYKEHERGYYKDPYKRWAKAIVDNNEAENVAFDLSYRELWDYLREECKLSEKDAYIFECTGGGRCFDENFQGNVNPELSAIIRQYEVK